MHTANKHVNKHAYKYTNAVHVKHLFEWFSKGTYSTFKYFLLFLTDH